MSFKNWIISHGIIKLLDRDELDEKLIAMIEVLDKKLDGEFKDKQSEKIQDALVKKLLLICKRLKQEDPYGLQRIARETFNESGIDKEMD